MWHASRRRLRLASLTDRQPRRRRAFSCLRLRTGRGDQIWARRSLTVRNSRSTQYEHHSDAHERFQHWYRPTANPEILRRTFGMNAGPCSTVQAINAPKVSSRNLEFVQSWFLIAPCGGKPLVHGLLKHVLVAQRLRQKFDGACFHRPDTHRSAAGADNEDNWNIDLNLRTPRSSKDFASKLTDSSNACSPRASSTTKHDFLRCNRFGLRCVSQGNPRVPE